MSSLLPLSKKSEKDSLVPSMLVGMVVLAAILAFFSILFAFPLDFRQRFEVLRSQPVHNDYGQTWRYDVWVKGEEFAVRYPAYCAKKELNAQGEVERYYGGTGYRCLELEEIPKVICATPFWKPFGNFDNGRWTEKC